MKIGNSISYCIWDSVISHIVLQVKFGIPLTPINQLATELIHDLVTNSTNLRINEDR
jgi:hypothetical protein